MRQWIEINRAPVLTLWAAVVAERLGFHWEEALTLGRAVAGFNAYSKGKTLGLFEADTLSSRGEKGAAAPAEGGGLDRPAAPQDPGYQYGRRDKGASKGPTNESGLGHELSRARLRRRARRRA